MIGYLIAFFIIIVILTIFNLRDVVLGVIVGFLLNYYVTSTEIRRIGGAVDDFPYKKISIKSDELKDRFDRLKRFKFDIVPHSYKIKNVSDDLLKYEGQQLVINHPKSYYDEYDNISDYFIEPARIKCIRSDQKQSVQSYWMSNKNDVIAHCKRKYKKISKHNLRESLYDLISECNTFKPSLIVGFIKMFKAKSILDISAGWGDRLIGSLSQNVSYTGVDPADLHQYYDEMINFFDHKSKTTLIKAKFEDPFEKDYEISEVDMVFSSPPFYDLEKYHSIDTSQSYMNRSLDDWYNEFLMVSIKKAWFYIKNKGHMVLYIADAYNRPPYVQRMITDINKFSDSTYLGCLPQMDIKQNIPRPFWIWQKIKSDKLNLQKPNLPKLPNTIGV